MASWRKTTTSLHSFSGVPVFSLVIIKTRGHVNGKVPFGFVTSNTIRCLPFILLTQASGSSADVETFSGAAARLNGIVREARLTAPAPMANDPKNPRRLVVGLDSCNCIKFKFKVKRIVILFLNSCFNFDKHKSQIKTEYDLTKIFKQK